MTVGARSFDVISKIVHTPPERIQVAWDGNWMEAWRFGQDGVPSPDIVEAAVAGRGADVAVEFCFKLPTGENFFFGQRRRSDANDPDAVAFVNRAIACGRERDWIDLSSFRSRLEHVVSELEPSGPIILCDKLKNAEIGITDWWRRGDVVEIWSAGKDIVQGFDPFRKKLDQYPSILTNDINFLCLEFNFESVAPHWFGIEVSRTDHGIHYFDAAAAYSWLTRCLGLPETG